MKILITESVLLQALEALEYADTYWQGQNAIDLWGPAIIAIKDALAETAPKAGDGETATLSQPLQKLGARLAELLDEDQWAECEVLLLAASHQETYTARPPTPTGWSDTDWIKHLQEQHPMSGLHINKGSMDIAYFAKLGADKEE